MSTIAFIDAGRGPTPGAVAMERPGRSADLGTQQRGNAMLYRQPPAMSAAAAAAIAESWVQRVMLHVH